MMPKLKHLQNLRTVYIFFAVLAVLFTTIISNKLPFQISKYRLSPNGKPIPVPNPLHRLYFYDSEGDGHSEMIRLKSDPNNTYTENGVVVYRSNGVLTFQKSLREKWIDWGLMFGDYNNDNLKEVYIFTETNDSLFLYGFENINDDKFFIERQFIMCGNQKHLHSEWDLHFHKGKMIDYDQDGSGDLMFGIVSGYSQEPRGIFIYSIRKKEIIKSTPRLGAYLGGLDFANIDDDLEEEIITGGQANYNVKTAIDYPDSLSYLMIFDEDLQLKYTPIEFNCNQSHIQPIIFKSKKQNKIFAMLHCDGADISPELHIYDYNSNKSNEPISKKIKNTKKIDIFTIPQNGDDKLFYFDYNNYLHQVDDSLKEIRTIKINNDDFNKPKKWDLNGDGNEEIIFKTDRKVLITDKLFKYRCTYKAKNCEKIIEIYKKKAGLPYQLFGIRNEKELQFYKYELNPWFILRYPVNLIVFFITFLLSWILLAIYRWRLFSKKLIQVSADDSGRGILRIDTRGRIKYINTTFSTLVNSDHYLGKNEHFLQAFHNVPIIKDFIQNIIGNVNGHQQKIETSPSLKMTGTILGKPIKNALGIPFGYLIELHDYSKPIQDDRIKTWSKTVQKMAHDIKTPMSSIALNLKVLYLKLTDQSPEISKNYENEFALIQGELKRVTEMSKSFMKFVNLEKPNIQASSLSEIVNRAKGKFRTFFNGDIQFSSEIDNDADRIWADPQQLEIVFQILIENSIDALKGRGQILVTAQLAQYLDKNFENYVEVNISDTGTGISSEIKNQIFEPYFTTKSEGTGIGLAIVKKIIEDHGGEIEVSSRVDFATTFRIMLPMRNDS